METAFFEIFHVAFPHPFKVFTRLVAAEAEQPLNQDVYAVSHKILYCSVEASLIPKSRKARLALQAMDSTLSQRVPSKSKYML